MTMTKQDIYDAIYMLAQSQGSYGRMLYALDKMSDEEREEVLGALEGLGFSDAVDLVIFLEGS